jgi:methylated-DNA-[protein]-cysteine S-methyltransferase
MGDCFVPRSDISFGLLKKTFLDSYIAMQIGHPNACRAVGRANATNPMPIVIPCHRVIGRDGKLHGYGGGDGLSTKEWLLKLEGAVIK